MIAFAIAALGLLGAEGTDDAFEAFFARYAEQRDGIRTLEARFSQKSVVPGEPIVTTVGDLVYVRPRRIVMRTNDPETATLVEGGMFYEYDADFRQLVITPLEDEAVADIFFMAFDKDTTSLRENYTVELLLERDDPRGKEGILIRPKVREADTPAPFEEVTVYLRDEDMLPYEVQIAFDADSQVYFYVTDYTVNGALAPERTQLELPPGTKIIESGELKEEVGPEGKRVPEPAQPGAGG